MDPRATGQDVQRVGRPGTAPANGGPALDPVRLSVVLSTRNRPEDLQRCVTSILQCDHDSFEVIVVDQSDAAVALDPDPRVCVLRSSTIGKSAGLNEGIAVARGPLLVFTDDDCTVSDTWLGDVETVFARNLDVEMMFGNLKPIDHDASETFVPTAEMCRFEVIVGPERAWVRGGAGANMAARRSMFDRVDGFDELIGPGSRFRSCEEFDIYYRALAVGYAVARVPHIAVLHWGARSYGDGSGQRLLRSYAYGEGAVIGKHLRLGDLRMVRPGVRIMRSDAAFVLGNLVQGRLSGAGPWAFKWRGLVRGLRTKVDRDRRVFAP